MHSTGYPSETAQLSLLQVPEYPTLLRIKKYKILPINQYNKINKSTLISKAFEIKAAIVGNGTLQCCVIASDNHLQKKLFCHVWYVSN